MSSDLDEYPTAPLDEIELKKIRRMLRENEQAHFLWKFLIRAVIIGGSISGAIVAVKNTLSQYVTFK